MTAEFPTIKAIQAYVSDQSGRKVTVSRTEQHLSIAFVKGGEIEIVKVLIPGSVLYCVGRKHLDPAIEVIKRELPQ